MKIVVNKTSFFHTSKGGQKYFNGILSYLNIPIFFTKITKIKYIDRIISLIFFNRNQLYWSPSHIAPIYAPNHIITVLDCINIEYTTASNKLKNYLLRKLFLYSLKNTKKIIAISEATKNSILKNFPINPEKIIVIPGPTEFSIPECLEYSHRIKSLKKNTYVLLVSNSLFHKNTLNVLKAISKSLLTKNNYRICIVGSVGNEVADFIKKKKINIDQFYNLTDSDMYYLYSNALFFISGSIDEGLNMPIGEALSYGCPVLCSDIPVHKEFYLNYVKFFNPFCINSISEAINFFLNDLTTNSPNNRLEYKGKTFKQIARQYEIIFKQETNIDKLFKIN